MVTGRLPELKGGYWLWICIILFKRYIYMGIFGKERFFLNDCCHNSFNFMKNFSLYIYIDCYMSFWIIKTRSKIF